MMTLVFADEASYWRVFRPVCVCGAWHSMMELVFADEASVSETLQTFPHYQKRDKCTAVEGEQLDGREGRMQQNYIHMKLVHLENKILHLRILCGSTAVRNIDCQSGNGKKLYCKES